MSLDGCTTGRHESLAESRHSRLPAALESRVTIQGVDVTRMGAIYHVVEHFAMHTGQILWIAKARIGRELGFYAVAEGKARATWTGTDEGEAS